ncbi:TrpB-like pyridoxal phosphate-dependent enzyme [Catenuloplanes indicus]|uniref:tryptophan synthase n=1 Tax=Catenuloplanes indicus TaxID=137267 RepID=A0AAE4AVH1_9ACTN|nr:TrpB-like pyridoxal phosphate-dependent enzyme [Catenuloplanes indicus]MDQ0364905.1 tryptophan synthase beta chain [Catenuloplanes indicus]
MTAAVPPVTAWYNVLADRDVHLPPPRPPRRATGGAPRAIRPNIPKALVRQAMPLQAEVPIPEELREAYREWRPTPLRRATRLEAALGTTARIYLKDETGNVAGSHKYLTALAQAYYYRAAGVRTLITSTAAGQWGTAISAAARRFGLGCVIYMVPGSYDRKPGRRLVMEMLGAEVIRADPGALREAMNQAVSRAAEMSDARWILGGSESFAILHSTVIGQEAKEQLRAVGEVGPPVLIGYLGGGKNVGGLGLPFLAGGGTPVIRSVESAAFPVLTRGTFAYDDTDDTGLTPRAAMYTLGRGFTGSAIQAEGIRYRAAPTLFSALRERGLVQPVAYPEEPVFDSARLLLRTEGILVSAEAAYAVHDACEQARDPGNRDRPIVACVSDHGYYDADAYQAYLSGRLAGRVPSDEELAATAPDSVDLVGALATS